MAMEWEDYSQTKPHNKGWYLVLVDAHSYQMGYADIDYWDGTKWKFIQSSVTWWCEITPPPFND